jgi:hypothetical protein
MNRNARDQIQSFVNTAFDALELLRSHERLEKDAHIRQLEHDKAQLAAELSVARTFGGGGGGSSSLASSVSISSSSSSSGSGNGSSSGAFSSPIHRSSISMTQNLGDFPSASSSGSSPLRMSNPAMANIVASSTSSSSSFQSLSSSAAAEGVCDISVTA